MPVYDDLTPEQLISIITEQADQMKELETERDSLREENNALISKQAEQEEELKNVKKLNYTLARKIDSGNKKPSFDESIIAMFGRK